MKSIINVCVVAVLLALALSCSNGGKQAGNQAGNAVAVAAGTASPVNTDQLPKEAKDYIDKYLPGSEIVRVVADDDDVKVWLRSGELLEFDIEGKIKEIECATGVPASAIDERILKDVKSSDPQANIVEIDKDGYGGYEVKLDNGKDISYDANCKRIGLDD